MQQRVLSLCARLLQQRVPLQRHLRQRSYLLAPFKLLQYIVNALQLFVDIKKLIPYVAAFGTRYCWHTVYHIINLAR